MHLRQGSTTRARSRLIRWLPPVVLAAAVLAMHGLGHPSGHGGHMAGMPVTHATASHHAVQQPAPGPAVSGPVLTSAGITGPAVPGGLDPVAVCLAVLAGMLLLLPLLRRARLPGALHAAARGWAGWQYPARSPPRAPSLSALQVLRL